jgi:hypothetical protein
MVWGSACWLGLPNWDSGGAGVLKPVGKRRRRVRSLVAMHTRWRLLMPAKRKMKAAAAMRTV